MSNDSRPLSPHLQVYRPEYTMVLSILHRLSGLALSASAPILVIWLVAAARGADAYATAIKCLASIPVRLLLAAALVAFWYHLFAGLRHMAWDAGHGFERATARKSGLAVVTLALLASMLTLVLAWRHFAGHS